MTIRLNLARGPDLAFPIDSSAHLTMNDLDSIPIGVDIAKCKFDAAILRNGRYRHKVFPNTPAGFDLFLAWFKADGAERMHVVMEATGAYSVPLAEFLTDRGMRVSVVNPAKIKAFARSELSRVKTDKADAKLIARYAQQHNPPPWNPPPPAIRELQALLRRAEQLQGMRQSERNRLATADSVLRPSIEKVLATLDREIESLRAEIQHRIDADPVLQGRRDLLASIPGLGEVATAHLLVLFSPHLGFQNAKQAVAFVGLAPNPHQSGQSQRTRLSKIGDALLRKVLYMPAIVAWRHNPAIRAFCERLKANGKPGRAIICAAMRKLIHVAFGVLKSGRPFDPALPLA
jgi:transposase